MNILCDCDGVLIPFTEKLIQYINRKIYPQYRLADFTEYVLENCIKPDHRRWLKAAPNDRNFAFDQINWRYEGAQQFVKDLVKDGHHVTLVTALWEGPHWEAARQEWFESFLSAPELRKVEYAFTTPKERVMHPGDVLIDDRRETLEHWAETNRHGFCMNQPWNQGALPDKIKRVYDYGTILEELKKI